MGSSESTLSQSNLDVHTRAQDSSFILKLFSKQFETDEDDTDRTELYLDDYGEDDDSLSNSVEPIPSSEPQLTAEEDDDYPIDTLNANIGKPDDSGSSCIEIAPEPEATMDIGEAFDSAKKIMQAELDSKYPAMPMRISPCERERDSLMQCYKENEDILNCRDLVAKYSACAKSASSEKLNKQS